MFIRIVLYVQMCMESNSKIVEVQIVCLVKHKR